MNMKFTILYEIFDIIYLSIYLVCRGIMAPVVIYKIYAEPKVSNIILIFAVSIFIQSLGFMKIMLIIIKKKYLHYLVRKSKGISYWWFNINPKLLELDYVRKKIDDGIF